jgi:hypothetical protein
VGGAVTPAETAEAAAQGTLAAALIDAQGETELSLMIYTYSIALTEDALAYVATVREAQQKARPR